MANYEGSHLVIAARRVRAKVTNLNKHLKTEGPHDTNSCEYCNGFAKEIGLFVSPLALD